MQEYANKYLCKQIILREDKQGDQAHPSVLWIKPTDRLKHMNQKETG